MASMMTAYSPITIISDPQLLLHDTGGGEHPEVPQRIECIERQLQAGPLGSYCRFSLPRPAQRSHLLAFHREAWLFRFEEAVLSGRTYIDHTDNQIGYESFPIAILSAGSGLTGIDHLESDSGQAVFCLTRPPGHHAEPDRPFGFCFLNNCVIATRYWQQKYGRQRICIFDFDAHHGNGIQTACEEDRDTLYISLHEHPSFSYPGTGWAEEKGIGEGKGTILNIPLSPGSGDSEVLRLLDGPIDTAIRQFQPEGLVIAAGFDGHARDDMSGLAYSTALYAEIGKKVARWAHQLCGGRMLSILEGGYELEVLGASVESYLCGVTEK